VSCNGDDVQYRSVTLGRVKTRTLLSLWLISGAVLITSCSPAVKVDNGAADAAAIQALDERWSAAAGRKDLAATVAFYAADAVFLPPNAPIAADQKAIREGWAALLVPGTTVSWKVSKAEVARSGDLGYIYGTYSSSQEDPKGGPAIRDNGKLVEIWKKQADGQWKCIVDTYNSDLPAAVPH
jgi:ketosteroid isomerase-like protein